MEDRVNISEQLCFSFGGRTVIAPHDDVPKIHVEGFFRCVCRERGKLVYGTRREGHNVWTLTGREYLAALMSYNSYGASAHGSGQPNPDAPMRDDRIRYIGFGTGSKPMVSSVSSLATPVSYDGTVFLAQLDVPPTFPLTPTLSTVVYSRTFGEREISFDGPVILSEAGLFTDGSPESNNTPRSRDTTLLHASQQAPAAYKTFDPFKKTSSFELIASWEVRF